MRLCKYDVEYACIVIGECKHTNLLDCLKAKNYMLLLELEQIRELRGKRHTSVSTKWRNQALYYKRRARLLEMHIEDKGLPVPSSKELMGMPKPLEDNVDEKVSDTNSPAV